MKSADKLLSKSFGPLVIDQRVLQKITQILSECEEIEISDGESLFESIDELIAHHRDKTLLDLKIESSKPRVTVYLGRSSSHVETWSTDTFRQGIFSKLVDLLKPHQRWPSWFHKPLAFLPFPLVYGIAFLSSKPWSSTPLIAASGFAAIAIYAWIWRVHFHRHSVIKIFDQGLIPGFFKRNFDTLVVGTVCSLIGAFLGVLFTKYMT